MNLRDFFVGMSYQKILVFLSDNFNKSFFDKQIAQETKLSRGATNTALRKLAKSGLLSLEKKGRMSFYSADFKNPLIGQWKVLNNILEIFPLLKKLEKLSSKVILFGSAAEGTNIKESGIDIFIVSEHPRELREIVSRDKRNIQLVAKTPAEFVEMGGKNKVFFNEVMRGIVLWEKV